MPLHWRWRVYERSLRTGKLRWRELRWMMTEEDAASWAAANGHKIPDTMEKVPGSSEERGGGYEIRVWNYMKPRDGT